METPLIRAKARDAVDALDNLTAYAEPHSRDEIVEFVKNTLCEIEGILTYAQQNQGDPVEAFRTFTDKFNLYWDNPPV